jgi:hypothetical protein
VVVETASFCVLRLNGIGPPSGQAQAPPAPLPSVLRPQAGQVEDILRSLDITEPGVLLRAAAIDEAARDVLAHAASARQVVVTPGTLSPRPARSAAPASPACRDRGQGDLPGRGCGGDLRDRVLAQPQLHHGSARAGVLIDSQDDGLADRQRPAESVWCLRL